MKTIIPFPKGIRKRGWDFVWIICDKALGALVFMSWKKRYTWHSKSSIMTVYASYTGYLTQMPEKLTQLLPSGTLLNLNIPYGLETHCIKYKSVYAELFLLEMFFKFKNLDKDCIKVSIIEKERKNISHSTRVCS